MSEIETCHVGRRLSDVKLVTEAAYSYTPDDGCKKRPIHVEESRSEIEITTQLHCVGLFNPYPTSVKLYFVATVRSSPSEGPLNRWECLTTRLFKSLGVFNDALDNTRL